MTTTCGRCRGFMVGGWWGSLRRGRHRPYARCVNCGNIEDPVILANRWAGRPSPAMIARAVFAELFPVRVH